MNKKEIEGNKSVDKLAGIKKHYPIIVLALIILWGVFTYLSNDYCFKSKTVFQIIENKTVEKQYLLVESKHFVLSLLASFFMTAGITLFISMFFSNYFDKKEKEAFEQRLVQYQEETAKNAFLSLFHQIVDESFFNVIKNDIIQCKKIRKNARWIYDIEEKEKNDHTKYLVLNRTITYSVINLSSEPQEEEILFSSFSNSYLQSEFSYAKKRDSSDKEYEEYKQDELDTLEEQNGTKTIKKSIKLKSFKSTEIVKVIKQTFNSNYIYETQFANCPLSNLEIQVNYPSGYKFELSSALSEEPEKDTSNPRRIIYTFNNAILKGQGVEFYCESLSSQEIKLSTSDVKQNKKTGFTEKTRGLSE